MATTMASKAKTPKSAATDNTGPANQATTSSAHRSGLEKVRPSFTNTTNWVAYEGIQSDIFDHLIAMTDAFDLRLVQNFDYDISSLGPRAGAAAPAASGSAPASGS